MANAEYYVLTVQAVAGSQTGSTTLTVSITDVNDNEPVFMPAVYFADVDENSTLGRYCSRYSNQRSMRVS